ncbi:hypothetical protein [Azotobacter beijerinckii]|nr:hypothetical protein [Azotobacter beijerinckii]
MSKATRMAEPTCSYCRRCCDEAGGLVKRSVGWVCDDCDRVDDDRDLDVEGYEERRRQRLAEAQEY